MTTTRILQSEDIDHLFYQVLDRHPTTEEIAKVSNYIGGHFYKMAQLVQEYIREMHEKGIIDHDE